MDSGERVPGKRFLRCLRGGLGALALLCVAAQPARAEIQFDPPERIEALPWVGATAIGDVTSDGLPDLVAYHDPMGDGDEVRVYEQQLDGSLAAPVVLKPTSTGAYYPGLAIGDLNADGRNDVALAANAAIDVFLQTAEGTLNGPHPIRADNAPAGSEPWPASARSVQIADFDGDGLGDIAAGTYYEGAQFLRNTGSGFTSTALTPREWELQEIELGDLNSDGHLDIAWGPFPRVEFALAGGDGTFVDGGFLGWDVEDGMEVADLGDDGRDDVIVSAWSPERRGLYVFEQGTEGVPRDPTQTCNTGNLHLDPVEAADVTGNGLIDVVSAGDGRVLLYPGFREGGLSDAEVVARQLPPYNDPSALSLGDLNNDGRIDVALGSSGGLHVIRQSPDSQHVDPPHPCDSTPPAVEVADDPVTMKDDGTIEIDVTCPAEEVSGPCHGHLWLWSVEHLTFQGMTRAWSFRLGEFTIPAGETHAVSVGGWWEDRALLVQHRQLDVVAIARTRDERDNHSRVEATLEVHAPPDTEPLRCGGVLANHVGTDEIDYLRGGHVRDVFVAGAGDDRIYGRQGDDLICASVGDDWVRGGSGDDDIRGQAGADNLRGGAGDDKLRGGADPDILRGGRDVDTCRGGAPRPDMPDFGDFAAGSCERIVGALRLRDRK